MLTAKMSESNEALTVIVGVNRFECIVSPHSLPDYGTLRDDVRYTRLNQLN